MIAAIKRVLKPSNRSLIRELVASDFKLRYQGSVLGYFWSLLRPLMMFGVLFVVFTKIIPTGRGVPHFPSYLLLGLVLWTFFVEATVAGMNSITGRGDMIRKVSVSKYAIVISTTLSALVNFGLNMLIVIVFMLLGDVPLRPTILLAPIFIAELVVLCMAISFLLAALFVKFRDFVHIWDVGLQVLFYATPIIYPLSIVPDKLIKIISLNPLAQIIQDIRSLMITPETLTTKEVFSSSAGRLIPMAIVLATIFIAGWYFRRSAANFAEEL